MAEVVRPSYIKRLDDIYRDTERAGAKINASDLNVIASRFFFLSNYVLNKRVVEFGAGSILGKSKFLTECLSYIAVELHPTTAAELKDALGDKFTVINEDCCATSLPDDCCDLIIAFAMIYYNDFEDLVKEAKRLLVPGGKIIFCSPNACNQIFSQLQVRSNIYNHKKLKNFAPNTTFL